MEQLAGFADGSVFKPDQARVLPHRWGPEESTPEQRMVYRQLLCDDLHRTAAALARARGSRCAMPRQAFREHLRDVAALYEVQWGFSEGVR